MKSIVKLFLALALMSGFHVISSIAEIEAILSANGTGEPIVALSDAELSNIMDLPPSEAAARLIAEGESRIGSEYAKALVFSAGLIEMLHVPATEHQALGAVTEWATNARQDELEDKLLKAFSPLSINDGEKVSILQSLIAEFDESEQSPTTEIYGRALIFGLSDVTVLELLKLKLVGVLVALGDFESADPMLEEAEEKQWTGACADYLAGIRLLRDLLGNDTMLFMAE